MTERAVPTEATDLMVAAGLDAALKIMAEHDVNGLSPFADYPSPSMVIRRVYNAMILARASGEEACKTGET